MSVCDGLLDVAVGLSTREAPLLLLQALVSVSTIGTQADLSDEELTATVKKELAAWWGSAEVRLLIISIESDLSYPLQWLGARSRMRRALAHT